MDNSPPDDSRLSDAEAKMRRALGLDHNSARVTERTPISKPGDPHQPRRRQFVRDGDVPVTIIHHQSNVEFANQLDSLRQAIRTQAAAREHAERLLEQAQATIRQLQTTLAHERLANDEAIGRANADRRASQQALEIARAELSADKIARERAEQALRSARASIGNLTERLGDAKRELEAVKAELATERRNAVEAARTTIAAPVIDASVSDDATSQTVRRPLGRPRKPALVLTIEKPVSAVGKGSGQPVAGDEVNERKKIAGQREKGPRAVRWWLGER